MFEFTKLGGIATLTVGYVGNMTQEYTGSGVPFLRSLNIKPFHISESDIRYISEEFNMKIKKSVLRENDVVIVRTGIPGTCCVVPKEYDGCNCSDIVIVHPDKTKVHPDYLAAYINVWGQKQISNNKVGAIQQHFNVRMAEDMLIALPPLKEQKKIAEIIKNINEKIFLNQRINDNLQAQMSLIYEDMIAKANSNRVAGKFVAAKELTEVVTGKEDANFSAINGIYKFFTCSNTPLQCDEFAFDSSSILIAGNGDFNVKHYSGKFNAYQRTYVLTPSNKYYAILYLACLYQVNSFKTNSSGSIVKFITKGDVENIQVFIPDDEALLQKLNHLLQFQEQNDCQNEHLTQLRDFLLPMLMNGQATIAD